jgi:cytochrome c-type biogenesis protein CcmH/NrfF
VVPRTPLEKDLQRALICMCGTCGRQLLSECSCGYAAQMREELAGLVAKGMTRDEVIQYYIAKYGSQEPLAAPIDKGFNRLAWLLPYVLGGSGALAVMIVAFRWSRPHPETEPSTESAAPPDPKLEARLDDELRDLD